MSFGRRLWRAARQRVLEEVGRAAEQVRTGHPEDAARQELEEFLRDPAASAAARTPPPHPYAAEYRRLGVPAGADFAAVRQAWRRLVRENHPDRFAHDPAEQARAGARLREINEAYHRLRDHLSRK